MHKECQAQVGEILTEIIAYRQTLSGINDTVHKPQEVCVLDDPTHKLFQHFVVDRGIELPDVDFQAIERLSVEGGYGLLRCACAALDTAFFYTAVRVVSEHLYEYRFKDIHYGVMYDTVRIIR